MKKRKPYDIRLFSIVAILFMVFSSMTPAFAASDVRDHNGKALEKNSVDNTKKMSNRLVKEFEANDHVTFLVKFKETAKLDQVIEKAGKEAEKNNVSAHKANFIRHSSVISALKSTANAEQEDVLTYLNEEEKKGNAKDIHSFFIVNGISVTATKEVAEKMMAYPEVEKVLPNETRQLLTTDKKQDETAGFDEDDIEWNVDRVGAPKAWDKGFDGTGVVVASIDSGVEWDHPALKEKYRGYDKETGEVNHDYNWFDAIEGKAEPYDDIDHGTHVTGTMVGSEPDGTNHIGVAPGAKWIAVNAFSESGGKDTDLLKAAEWILAPTDSEGNTNLDMAPDIVNNSWGGGPGLDEWYRDVVKSWRAADIFPEFSAGNITIDNPGGSGSVAAPANYPESFATGSLDVNDEVADTSLRGPSPYDEIKPDIAAPGVNIRSSVPGGEYEGGWEGTSMAGPAVSGAIALMLEVDSNLEIEEIEDILRETATPITDDEYSDSPNNGYGSGLVDAYKAVISIAEGLGTIEGKVTSEKNEKGVQAAVSVQGGDRSVKTDSDTGEYRLLYESGEFTIQAEAYGHETASDTVIVETDQTTTVDFALSELPQWEISGIVSSESTGKSIENAKLYLVEDANIEPINTDENGHFDLKAYEGSYTLRVTAHDYRTKELEVTFEEGEIDQDIELEPYYTYPGEEIAYDDGTAESGYALYAAGDGMAVKMSLPEEKGSAIVTEGKFFFLDDFPDPGDTPFAVEVWDATGEDGMPGDKIAGPFDAEAIRDGESWTVVDLWEQNIVVEDDFYMVYINKQEVPYVPGLGLDRSSPFTQRNVEYTGGEWGGILSDTGNYMIRANVAYQVDDPIIHKPEKNIITNEEVMEVKGTASPTTTVELQNDNQKVDSTLIGDDGQYTLSTTLEEGKNELRTLAFAKGDMIGKSDAITATLDTIKPELAVDSPVDGHVTNKEVVTIEGVATDDVQLKEVTVDGQKANVNKNGDYSKRVLLDEGKNELEVIAEDEAGNQEKKTIMIEKDTKASVINELRPSNDQYVFPGDQVKISFTSDIQGGDAAFELKMSHTKNTQSNFKNKMEETKPGVYEGYWKVPSDTDMDNVEINVEITDEAGNQSTETAEGKLFVSQAKVGRIAGDIRYDTAVEISQSGWAESDTVILARGDNYADALAGVPLAHELDVPILLTPNDDLWGNTLAEIKRLGAKQTIVLGGEQAISETVIAQLKEAHQDTRRIEGDTRFETAAYIADELAPEGTDEAVVVNGLDFPDAMTVASYAAKADQPILLTRADKLPEATKQSLKDLNVTETIVAGGTKVVDTAVEQQLPSPIRLGGDDRYETNIIVADHYGVSSKHLYVATGKEYADALTGAVLSAKQDSGIVLVHDKVPQSLNDFLGATDVQKLTLFGGKKAISNDVEDKLLEIVN